MLKTLKGKFLKQYIKNIVILKKDKVIVSINSELFLLNWEIGKLVKTAMIKYPRAVHESPI